MSEQTGDILAQDVHKGRLLKIPHRGVLVVDNRLSASDFIYRTLQLDKIVRKWVASSMPARLQAGRPVSYEGYTEWLSGYVVASDEKKQKHGMVAQVNKLGFAIDMDVIEMFSRVQAYIDGLDPNGFNRHEVVILTAGFLRELEEYWQQHASPAFYISAYIVFQSAIDGLSFADTIHTSVEDRNKFLLLQSIAGRIRDAGGRFSQDLIVKEDSQRHVAAFASDAAADAFDVTTYTAQMDPKRPLKGRYARLDPMKRKRQ